MQLGQAPPTDRRLVFMAIGTAFLFGGLALGGLMSPALAMGVMAAYFAVMAEVFLATSSRGVFRMSFLGCAARRSWAWP